MGDPPDGANHLAEKRVDSMDGGAGTCRVRELLRCASGNDIIDPSEKSRNHL